MPQAALEALLADALQDRSLPRFAAEVPSELPMAVLANRNDVQLAAALYGADTDALPGGVIDTSGEALDIDAPGAEASGQPLYAHAVMQARDQVAGALQHLQMQSDIANTAYARVVDARADFEASKRRRDRGDISEVQLMEDFQGLLLDLHVLAAANGELAMAWVLFMGNVGGANGMGNDTAIDAMAIPQAMQATQATQAKELPFLHKVSRKLRNP
jgi:outer membrane protein TolC